MNTFKHTLENFKHQQQLLAMLIFFLVAVMIWIGASLFHSQRKLGISPEQVKLSQPLTPTLNQDILNDLETKQAFSTQQLQQFPIYMLLKDQGQVERVVEIGTKPEPLPAPQSSVQNFLPNVASKAAQVQTKPTTPNASSAAQVERLETQNRLVPSELEEN